jgi:hypothetical protein
MFTNTDSMARVHDDIFDSGCRLSCPSNVVDDDDDVDDDAMSTVFNCTA